MPSNPTDARPSRDIVRWVLRFTAALLLLSLGTYYGIVWFKSLAAPSVRSLGAWCLIVALLLVLIPHRRFRLIGGNVLGLLVGLFAFEAYASLTSGQDHPEPPSNSPGYYSMERGDVLGFGPARGFVNHSVLQRGGRVIYDVTYTIDDHGLRVAPASDAQPDGTLLFFGDSFTFGEGLRDDEAMPYVVGAALRGRYRVYNFAFQGYGPHQMLSELEHGLVERIVQPHGKVVAIYQAIPDHARRSAGLAYYDTHGPKYVLAAGAEPRFVGHFDDDGYDIFLKKFFLYQRIANVRSDVDEGDIELFGAVVAGARARLAAAYGADLHVLLWNDPKDRHSADVARVLGQKGLALHLMSDVLPGYPEAEADYTLAGDGHPNARANQLIAGYIIHRIIEPKPEARGAQPALAPASAAEPP